MTTLIFLTIIIVLLVFRTAKYKLHPFLSLLSASLLIGFLSGLNFTVIIAEIQQSFGDTLKSIGIIIIVFGTIISGYLEKSGGAKTMADNTQKEKCRGNFNKNPIGKLY